MFHRRSRSRLDNISHKKEQSKFFYFVTSCLLLLLVALFVYQKIEQAKLLAAEKKALTKVLKMYAPIQSSVAVINKSGQSFIVGSTKPFNAASTTKIILAACLLHEVELGNKSLSAQAGDYPVSFQLQEMVNQSNNDSWHALTNYIGLQNLSDYAQSIGIHYDVANNSITTTDEALFLQKLYTGELLNSQDTKLLLSYMQHTNDETLIPAVVSSDVTVYHKYGWLDSYLHDAAILVYHNKPFILVIYTNGNKSTYSKQVQLIQQVTKMMLQYEFGID